MTVRGEGINFKVVFDFLDSRLRGNDIGEVGTKNEFNKGKTMLGFGRKHCKEGHLMDPSWRVCPICLAPITAWLVVMNGPQKNKVYTMHEGKVKIGSGSDCEVRILLNNISRQHVILSADAGHYNITDLSSVTGTFVNNNQISSQDIIDGDIIRLGDTDFKFKCL